MTTVRVPFEQAVLDVTGGNQRLLTTEYKPAGAIPVIDQGQAEIAGFTDDLSAACRRDGPVVLFGDHTRTFKFVDFDFALGADGVKVLKPLPGFDARFLFHFLKTVRLPENLGYSRHFKYLKECSVPKPEPEVQRRIATILDKVDNLRRGRQEAIRLADEFLRAVFIDMFGGLDTVSTPKVELADVVTLDAPMVEPTSEEYADMLHVGPDRIEKGSGQLLACETARAEGLTSKKFLFDERYVLYSKIRPVLKKCAIAEFRGLCSADMYPVRPSGDEVTREFIWGLLLSDAFDRYVSTLPDRANIPKLNRVELNAFQFRLPSIESQRRYSSIVQQTMALKRKHYAFLKQATALPASLGFFD